MFSCQLAPEISEIENGYRGNHSLTLDKYPNIWLTLKLYKIPGAPKAGIEGTCTTSENGKVGERWTEQREKRRKDRDGKNNKQGREKGSENIIYENLEKEI